MSVTNPRVLAKPVKVKLTDGERILRPKQAHLIAAGETLTVCDIDSTGWRDVEDLSSKAGVTCPVCAKRIAAGQRVSGKALREAQKAEATDEPSEVEAYVTADADEATDEEPSDEAPR